MAIVDILAAPTTAPVFRPHRVTAGREILIREAVSVLETPGVGDDRVKTAAAKDFGHVGKRRVCQATVSTSFAMTSLAARSPERIAPSIHPHICVEVSVPAQ